MLYKAISGMLITALLGCCAVLKDQETQLHHEPVANLEQPAEQTALVEQIPPVEQIQPAEQTPPVEQPPPAEQIEKPPTLGVSYDDILTVFRDMDIHFDMEEASPVRGQSRSMGSTDDGLAYLEVIGNQADISQAALMLAIPSDNPEIRVRNAVLSVATLNYMFPDWEDRANWVSRTLERLRTTDDISDEIVKGERVLELVFAREPGMIVLTVKGKGSDLLTNTSALDSVVAAKTKEKRTQQEERKRAEARQKEPEVIGVYYDDVTWSPYKTITVFRSEGKIYMDTKYSDGSGGRQEMVRKRSSLSGICFRDKEQNDYGDYYRIDGQGNLQYWDNSGLIATVRRSNSSQPALLGGSAVLKEQEPEPVASLQRPAEQTPLVEQIHTAEQTPPAEKVEKPPTLGVSYDDILTLFRNVDVHFAMEEVTQVRGQTRSMGWTDDELAHLDVIGNPSDVARVTFMVGIPSNSSKLLARNAVLCLGFLKLMVPRWDSSSDWFNTTLERLLDSSEKTSEEIIRDDRVVSLILVKHLGMLTLFVKGKREQGETVVRERTPLPNEKQVDEVRLPPLSDGVEILVFAEQMENGKLLVKGKTNLPKGTHMMVTVRAIPWQRYQGQGKCAVGENGEFIAGPFSDHGKGLGEGDYEVEVMMPYPMVQSAEVRRLIGERGEHLSGSLVQRDELAATAEVTKTFTLGSQ